MSGLDLRTMAEFGMHLLSENLWVEHRERFPAHSRIKAAIAYVTTAHLRLTTNDVLICDASVRAITGGLTSPAVLKQYVDSGAKVYSYEGLHAKVAVIDEHALVGSANMSETAGTRTCEAALLTSDPQVLALILGYVEELVARAEPVSDEFIRRISSLPVRRTVPPLASRRQAPIRTMTSRVWFVATRDLGEKLAEAEATYDEAGRSKADLSLENESYESRSLRWSGRSRFRVEARVGDVVIEVHSRSLGNGKQIRVYPPAPIVHKMDEAELGWTRFYLAVPVSRKALKWKDIEKSLQGLAERKLTFNSTRELTGRELGISRLLAHRH